MALPNPNQKAAAKLAASASTAPNLTGEAGASSDKKPAKKAGAKKDKPAAPASGAPTVALTVVPKGDQTPTPGKSAKKGDTENTEPPKGFKFTESKRDVEEIISERVTILPGGMGLEVKEGTPLEEILPMVDHFGKLRENVGFCIGDLLVYGQKTYGEKLHWAMHLTKRAMSTVKAYYTVANAFPPKARDNRLFFTHHKVVTPVVSIEGKGMAKAKELLAKAATGGEGKSKLTTAELQKLADAEKPKKTPKPAAKKPGRKKSSKKNADKAKPREPNAEEQAALDSLFDKLKEADGVFDEIYTLLASKPSGIELKEVILKGDNNRKKAFFKAGAFVDVFATFRKYVDDHTGYTG